uniref:Uncharacterized protein n=1 Tax=Medicago truncatula TaxID=3880 RepID=I3S6S2_MEDTR|nr:unknown [Medicago truncatula]
MSIMTTCMHLSRYFAFMLPFQQFLHEKSIHVSSKSNKRRKTSSYVTNNTCNCNWMFILNTQLIQFCSYKLTSLKFLITQFRILMNFSPYRNHPVKNFRLFS